MDQQRIPDFPQVYAAFHDKVRAYAAKLIGPAEADDLTQQVFIKIDQSLEQLKNPAQLSAWVYTITLNTVCDLARQRASRPVCQADVGGRPQGAARADDPWSNIPDLKARSPEEEAIRSEMIACYLDYVKKLPRLLFPVYVLSEIEGLSDKEIAERLSITVGTAKIRLHRARTWLYEELRKNCRCYVNARGELMGEPKPLRPLLVDPK